MKWRLIDKNATPRPTSGTYRSWKPILAAEGNFQCVYCSMGESRFGGTRNFHVEHFRPKSKFRELENDFANLFYACGVCNSFKGNDWPRDPSSESYTDAFYPDPSKIDYSAIFRVDRNSGLVSGVHFTGQYVVERLHLNRPYSVAVRKFESAHDSLLNQIKILSQAYSDGALNEAQKDATTSILFRLTNLLMTLNSARPYTEDQLR